jgi:hypothetical protein
LGQQEALRGSLVTGGRHLVRKPSTDEMAVSRY